MIRAAGEAAPAKLGVIESSKHRIIADRYRLEEPLGRGGMGEVWAATNLVTNARVALKLLFAPAHLRATARQRLLAEARAANRVVHPNVIQIRDAIELEDHTLALVMELLTGEDLAQRLARTGTLTLDEMRRWMIPVVDGVAALHMRGIVHRDLKPANIFLSTDAGGQTVPKLLDFGIAKWLEPDAEQHGITGTGMTLGTPCYMAPEQGFGEHRIDARADIWSLGAVLYQCLSGIRPVEAENLGQYLRQLMETAILPLAELEPDVPPELAAVVMRMLARSRDERPPLIETRNALERATQEGATSWPVAADQAPAPRPRRLAVVGWIAAALGVIALGLVVRERVVDSEAPSSASSADSPVDPPVASVTVVPPGEPLDPEPGAVASAAPSTKAKAPLAAPSVASAAPSSSQRSPRTTPGGLVVDYPED